MLYIGHLVDRLAADLADRLCDSIHAMNVSLSNLAPMGVNLSGGKFPDMSCPHRTLCAKRRLSAAGIHEVISHVRGPAE